MRSESGWAAWTTEKIMSRVISTFEGRQLRRLETREYNSVYECALEVLHREESLHFNQLNGALELLKKIVSVHDKYPQDIDPIVSEIDEARDLIDLLKPKPRDSRSPASPPPLARSSRSGAAGRSRSTSSRDEWDSWIAIQKEAKP